MASSFSAHVRSDRAKWIVVAIALLLVGVILCGLMTTWFSEWNPFCWFGHNYGEDGKCTRCGADKPAEEEPVKDEQANSLVFDTVIAEGMQLLSEPALASDNVNTYTLTATITPANATNKEVDWSVSFVDPESTWATGKTVTDYVTVTPTSDGALTATVQCSQPFGSQIQVVCVSRENAEIKSVCTVDYYKRVISAKDAYNISTAKTGMLGYMESRYDTAIMPFNLGQLAPKDYYFITAQPNSSKCTIVSSFGVGTLGGDVSDVTYTVRLSDKFASKYGSYPSTYHKIGNPMFNYLTNEQLNGNTIADERQITTEPGTFHFMLSFETETYGNNTALVRYIGALFPCVLSELSASQTVDASSRCVQAMGYILDQFAGFYADETIPTEEKYTLVKKITVTSGEDEYTFERKMLVQYTAPTAVTDVALDQSGVVF